MILIHLLSNHFLRRLMFRPARIGAAQAPGGRCVVGASLQVRLTRIGHWESPAFVVCTVWVTWCMSPFSNTCNPNQKYRCSKLAP
jgi:hypothetical protein